LALVLNASDGTRGNPIDRGSEGGDISWSSMDSGSLLLRGWAGKSEADESSPLIKRHVGELVVAKGEGTVARVVGRDDILVVGEVLE